MRRLFPVFMVFLASLIGCGEEKKPGPKFNSVAQTIGGGDTDSKRAAPATDATPARDKDGGRYDKDPSLAMADALTGTERRPRDPRSREAQSGVLTAGSFDDNVEPRYFQAFVRTLGQSRWQGDLPSKFLGRRLVITVKASDGQPVNNARVRAVTGNGGVELLTRSDGRAVFLSGWDALSGPEITVTVTPPDGTAPITQRVPLGSERWEIQLLSSDAPLPRRLDLCLVLDTTGSMGDELEFLKSEVRGIAEQVRSRFPHVEQRFALIVYRDDGDEYVTRSFEFTPSVDSFREHLRAQSAGGGGDEPEAMHQALEAANQLRWRDDQTARVLFLVADAPPHAQHMGRALQAADGLRRKGVTIYPVACSGYNDACEFVMRASALMTGGQFLFLTDDSGVVAAHGEPHIPHYHVQRLDRLMTRMIADELSGKRIAPARSEILRTVGRPIN